MGLKLYLAQVVDHGPNKESQEGYVKVPLRLERILEASSKRKSKYFTSIGTIALGTTSDFKRYILLESNHCTGKYFLFPQGQ